MKRKTQNLGKSEAREIKRENFHLSRPSFSSIKEVLVFIVEAGMPG